MTTYRIGFVILFLAAIWVFFQQPDPKLRCESLLKERNHLQIYQCTTTPIPVTIQAEINTLISEAPSLDVQAISDRTGIINGKLYLQNTENPGYLGIIVL